MANETEPAKLLLPYLQRADELQKHEPLVAYYCRLYAMEKGLRIPQKERTKTTNALLVSLINQLEKDKKSIKLGPEDNLYVEGFASSVFAKADKQDRAGRADLNTAKTFYAASIFFEILNQFNERQPDIEQRQKYAVWKAAEIRKALKEGRRPEPGPPGDDNDLPDPPTSTAYDMGPSENNPASQPGVARPPGEDTTSRHHIKDLGRNESFPASYSGGDIPSPHADNASPHGFPPGQLPPSSYSGADFHSSGADYHSASFQQPPTPSRPHVPSNPPPDPQQYSSDHQQYSSDLHSLPQGFHPPENQIPPYTYPNFQTYPSFNDSTLPVAPSHQPYYTGSDMGYSHQSAPPAPDYPLTKHYDSPSRNQSAPPAPDYSSTKHYESQSRNGNQVATPAPSAVAYASDPNYLPPVEKITEAHKAARFAVGALAFDDVPVAVEFLRRSLELLTNPSAESH